MDQAGGRVPIAHLGWDLVLIGDEKRPRQWSVLAEGAIDRLCGVCSDPRQDAVRCMASIEVDGREWFRWRRDSNDRRRRKNQSARGAGRPPANETDCRSDECARYCAPRMPAKADEQTGGVKEICGGDEWQSGSSLLARC